MNIDDIEDAIAGSGITGGDIAIAVLLLVVGGVAYLLVGRILRRVFARATAVTPDLAEVGTRVVQFIVLWIFVAFALNVLGANAGWLTFLLIGLLAVGAFTAKPLLDGMVSSVAVAAHAAINVGEDIDVNGIRGTVEGLERRSTVVRTPDGARVYIPNSELVDATVIVLTDEPRRQTTIEFVIDYGSDIDIIAAALQDALPSTAQIDQLNSVRLVSLERGMRVAVDISHGSTVGEEIAALDAANRSIAAVLANHDTQFVR